MAPDAWKATFMSSDALKVAFLTSGYGTAPSISGLRMWDGYVTGRDRACNTAPVPHLHVIIIGRRVG